jgi:hypothetical protein
LNLLVFFGIFNENPARKGFSHRSNPAATRPETGQSTGEELSGLDTHLSHECMAKLLGNVRRNARL